MFSKTNESMIKVRGQEDYLDAAANRWQRRERKAKPKMRVHGRRLKELARKLSEKKI